MYKSIILNPEHIQFYVKDIRKIPVISHERQDEIFTALSSGNLTKKEENKLKEELVIGNLRFVISIAKGYQNQGLDILDLISEGNIGLIKAADKFDPNSGNKFISYAVWWVRQTIREALNNSSRTIRVPSNIIQEVQRAKKTKETIRNETQGRITEEYVIPLCTSLQKEINDEGDMLIDIIPNLHADNPEDRLNNPEEIKKKVDSMLSVLDDREKVIIEKYFGLTGVEANLDELGEEFSCTKERVRQIKDKSLKKLRNASYDFLKYL
jgi:RNA polymerase primary sigma factor